MMTNSFLVKPHKESFLVGRFLRSTLFCSESSLERYSRRNNTQQRNLQRSAYMGGGGGLLPTTTPNCVLEQTGPTTWDHVALLTPSLPLHHHHLDSNNVSVASSPVPLAHRASFSTNCSRSPRLSLARLNVSASPKCFINKNTISCTHYWIEINIYELMWCV